MEKGILLTIVFVVLCAMLLPAAVAQAAHGSAGLDRTAGRTIDPIVSTAWLAANSGSENLVIIDIRDPGSYAAAHIPGSINEPFVTAFKPETGPSSNWITSRNGLWLEVPDDRNLFQTIGSLGIAQTSRIVIVTSPNPDEPPFYGLANGTRVADTLIYAGIANVAILDGGYPKWVADGNPVTTDVPDKHAVAYDGKTDKQMFVPVDYVHRNLRKADLIDARDANVYFGVTMEPWTSKAGHIPGAASLPAPWIWTLNGDNTYTFKNRETLAAMAAGVLGSHRGRQEARDDRGSNIIVYCGVGGYASSWWFVLTQVLGYDNVKFFDGASQEWGMHYDMVPHRWE
jgi:thiosulfate/3-mercaptopyruvate sulfurtransferase